MAFFALFSRCREAGLGQDPLGALSALPGGASVPQGSDYPPRGIRLMGRVCWDTLNRKTRACVYMYLPKLFSVKSSHNHIFHLLSAMYVLGTLTLNKLVVPSMLRAELSGVSWVGEED